MPPGSHSTLQKSDGNHVRSLAGASHVIKTVSPPLPLPLPRPVNAKVASTLIESPESQETPSFHLTMRRSRMSSASRQPRSFHHIGHGTAPSTCCMGQNSPRVEYIPCPSRSARPWRITSERLFSRIHPTVHLSCCLELLLCG